MKSIKGLFLIFCLFSMFIFISGCQDDSGPAEKAGKKVDQMIEKSGDMAKDLGNKLEDSAVKIKEDVEK